MSDWLLVAAAGFLGGALNAVAGGGSFITLPALIFVGVPPVAANATGTAALLPGYIASAWRFRHDIAFPASLNFRVIALMTLAGGGISAGILLLSSEKLFAALIPWLILLATLLFLIGPWLLSSARPAMPQVTPADQQPGQRKRALAVLFCVCVYGGYFNGGLGIILLAALGLLGQTNLLAMNGVKNLMSALLTSIAVLVYAAGGAIASERLWVLAAAAICGGYAGAAFAYRIPQPFMQAFIVSVGLCMSLLFFLAD